MAFLSLKGQAVHKVEILGKDHNNIDVFILYIFFMQKDGLNGPMVNRNILSCPIVTQQNKPAVALLGNAGTAKTWFSLENYMRSL
jgi:hypothetical protein